MCSLRSLLFLFLLTLSLQKGEWLDTIDRQRNRASEAKQLIEFFVEFLDGREPEMFRDPSRLHEAAGHILKLSTFAAELALDAAQEDQIAKVSSRIESALLDEFAAAQKAQDYKKMTVRFLFLFCVLFCFVCFDMFVITYWRFKFLFISFAEHGARAYGVSKRRGVH